MNENFINPLHDLHKYELLQDLYNEYVSGNLDIDFLKEQAAFCCDSDEEYLLFINNLE